MRRSWIFVALLLASCGGGGGGGGGGGAPAPQAAAIGERGLPGYAVRLERLGPVQPGALLTVRATIAAEPGTAPPIEVAAALQADAPTVWVPGVAAAGTWSWTFTVPDAGDRRVWVRVADADGNSSESGSEDFALP
jgi:hypothetical protein